jgi:outer membrane protein OmpA-like peptidoglycan-associated protein
VVLTITYEAPKTFTLNSIQFETGKADLKASSYTLLDDLVEIMTLKPTMKILIGGHTDSDGDDAANLVLSQKRADAVKNYLISKGINSKRIIAIGYGETKPVADNSTTEGKAKNRRTEIKIL